MSQMTDAFADLGVHFGKKGLEGHHFIRVVKLEELLSEHWDCCLEKFSIFLEGSVFSSLVHGDVAAEEDEKAVCYVVCGQGSDTSLDYCRTFVA